LRVGKRMSEGCSQPAVDRPEGGGVRVTLLTPPGKGALAVVGVAGPGATALVASRFTPRGRPPLAARPAGAIVFGRWQGEEHAAGEDLVVVRLAADHFEVHCHGGLLAPEAVIASLERQGATRQAWPRWLADGGEDEIAVEAREALAAAGGPKAARILARQLAGALAAEIDRVRGLVAAGATAEARAAIDRLLAAARVGLRLATPWRVLVIGRVNAGKSSLVNALAGHARSIVSAEPGTTRDLLETRVVLDGWEIDLVDTAGTRDEPGDVPAAEREGIARAQAARSGADLVLHVADAGRPGAAASAAAPDELVIVAKADLAGAATASPVGPAGPVGPVTAVWTSAVSGTGIGDLAAAIVRRLVPEEAERPGLLAGAVPFTRRQVDDLVRLRPPG
jgi:tRNA modification GTPase